MNLYFIFAYYLFPIIWHLGLNCIYEGWESCVSVSAVSTSAGSNLVLAKEQVLQWEQINYLERSPVYTGSTVSLLKEQLTPANT